MNGSYYKIKIFLFGAKITNVKLSKSYENFVVLRRISWLRKNETFSLLQIILLYQIEMASLFFRIVFCL